MVVALVALQKAEAAGTSASSSGLLKGAEHPASQTLPAVTEPASTPAVGATSDRNFGFRPPPAGSFVSQALVPWVNRRTGERFTAPTGGWLPPSPDWVVEDPTDSAPSQPATRSGTSR
ncbi:MAG: hypothetical protein ACKO8O_06865 [Betaproteobacteria bacterium]